jgi:hypothetical protein
MFKIKIGDDKPLVKLFVQKLNTRLFCLYCFKFFLFDAFKGIMHRDDLHHIIRFCDFAFQLRAE